MAARDSNREMESMGTPWLMTLKNPNSSHAFTMRDLASGFDRSTRGMLDRNVGACFGFRMRLLYFSVFGFDITTIFLVLVVCFTVFCYARLGREGKIGDMVK